MNRTLARRLAAESIGRGIPLDWFEALYRQAKGDGSVIPWADMHANPNLVEWSNRTGLDPAGKSALVIGCGLGDDAEELARRGFRVTAFDISPTAIAWCHKRFPGSTVAYMVVDLFSAGESWHRRFDFVLEAYTLQVLPPELRRLGAHRIAEFVLPKGTLLVITRGREPQNDPGQMPWPLVREELSQFEASGLSEIRFEDNFDNEQPPVRRFRVEYQR